MKRLQKFEAFSDEHNAIMKSRREEQADKQINHMLTNAIMFQRMKLTQQVEKLEKEKVELVDAKNNDRFVKSNPDQETNPVLVEYLSKISDIDNAIAQLQKKIDELKG